MLEGGESHLHVSWHDQMNDVLSQVQECRSNK